MGIVFVFAFFGFGASLLSEDYFIGTENYANKNALSEIEEGAGLQTGDVDENGGSGNTQNNVKPMPLRPVKDVLSEEELKRGEENTVIESIVLVGGDSSSFFAGAEISDNEQNWFSAGEENSMPEYGATAENGKWEATLAVGEENYILMITGVIINQEYDLVFPDTLAGYEVVGLMSFSFENKELLTGITVSKFMSSIPAGVFSGCTGITEFAVKSGNEHFSAVAGVLYNYDITRLIAYPLGKLDNTYELPVTIEYIPAGIFVGSVVTEITVADGALKNIDGWFVNSDYSEEFDGNVLESDFDLFPKWSYRPLQILYFDGGAEDGIAFSGDATGLVTEHIYSQTTNLVLPDSTLFLGFYDNYKCEGEPIVSLEANKYTEDIVLYAKWDVLLEYDEENDWYIVDSIADLQGLADYVNAGNTTYNSATFMQMADIDLGNRENLLEPIGVSSSYPFKGIYDGNGYKIEGINIKLTTKSYVGLFGYVNAATVKNVVVASGLVSGSYYVAGIVGYVTGASTISGCVNFADVTAASSYAGGIVGYWSYPSASSTIYVEHCANYGDIEGSNYVGGVVGSSSAYATSSYASTKYIQYCYNHGNVDATYTSNTYVGGIIGYASSSYSSASYKGYHYLKYCYSTGSVTSSYASTKSVGGVVGYATVSSSSGSSAQITMTNCYWLSGTASSSYGGYSNKTPTISGSTAQTKSALKGGSLTGLTDSSIWFYDGINYPTLVAEQYTYEGVVYSSIEKNAIIDITEDFDSVKYTIPASADVIEASAFAGAESVNTTSNVGTIAFYTDKTFTSAYNGELQDATQRLYLDWDFVVLSITYLNNDGTPFSEQLAEGSPQEHEYGSVTELKGATRADKTFFAGWSLVQGGDWSSVVTKLGPYNIEKEPILLYAVWIEPLLYDTADDIFEVAHVDALKFVSMMVNNDERCGDVNFATSNYRQVCDIAFEDGDMFEPIGKSGMSFKGSYDGQGFEINNLQIEKTENYAGVWGSNSGTIKNVVVKSGYVKGKEYAGGIAGSSTGPIQNCKNYATISGTTNVGGIVGYSQNTSNCVNYGEISGSDQVAGCSGVVYGTMTACVNFGNVKSTGTAGGVVGELWRNGYDDVTTSKMEKCVNYGNVVSTSTSSMDYAGGVVANAWCNPSSSSNLSVYVNYCANYGYVEAYAVVGGIVGYADPNCSGSTGYVYVQYCHNNGEVVSKYVHGNTGGIVGEAESSYSSSYSSKSYVYIRYCYSVGLLQGKYIGGVVGLADVDSDGDSGQVTMTNSYWLSGTASASYGTYDSLGKTPTVSASTVQTESALKGGSLTGLTDSSIWYYNGLNYPTLVGEQFTEDGVVYSSVEKHTIVDITEDFDAAKYNLAASVTKIKANAFAGAGLIVMGSTAGSYSLYTDSSFTTQYTGTLQEATQDLYVSWVYTPLNITYLNNDGTPFSDELGYGTPLTHTCGSVTELVRATRSDNALFAGWALKQGADIYHVIDKIDVYQFQSEPIYLYAVWIEELKYDDESNTIEVWDATGLRFVADQVNKGYSCLGIDFATASYKQMANIDFEMVEDAMAPIGNYPYVFGGSYDGNGYEIIGMYITGGTYVGLFGYVIGATIQNVIISSGKVTGSSDVGGIVGYTETLTNIINCVNYADIVASGKDAGGILGRWQYTATAGSGKIEGCANYGNVSGTYEIGGIVGYSYADIGNGYTTTKYITNCHNQGNVTATSSSTVYVGGIVGYARTYYSTYYTSGGKHYIQNCYSTGTISAPSASTKYVGGIVGYSYVSSSSASASVMTLKNCYFLSGSASAVYGSYYNKAPSVTSCSAQTESAIKGGTLTGLTDTDVWCYDGENYPTLVADRYHENGVIYASRHKTIILDITDAFNSATYVLPESVKLIKAYAFAGATSVNVVTKMGTPEFYTDSAYSSKYAGELPNATQDLYVKWTYKQLQITYLNNDGTPLSATLEDGSPTVHTYGTSTTLKKAIRVDNTIFVGWSTSLGGGLDSALAELGAYDYEEEPILLYAIWAEGLAYDSSNDVIEVSSADGLKAVSYFVNNNIKIGSITFATASYLQTADIDLGSVKNALAPIGLYSTTAPSPFKGTYDGNGKNIANININVSVLYVGLFAYVWDATIKNVTISSGTIKGKTYVGGIVGNAYGTTLIEGCENHASVTGVSQVGGIVGRAEDLPTIRQCVNYGNVKGTSNEVGGVVGCYWTDKVSSVLNWYIEYSGNYGDVNGESSVGGIVGWGQTTVSSSYAGKIYIRYCYNNGNITGSSYVGGIAGQLISSYYNSSYYGTIYIQNCYSTGTISSTSSTPTAGGIVGWAYFWNTAGVASRITITNCYWKEGTATAAYGKNTNNTPSMTSCSAQTESALKGRTLTGLTDTSIWYYDGGTNYPKLQFEVGNTMPTLSASEPSELVENQNEDNSNLSSVAKQEIVAEKIKEDDEQILVSSLKVFGLSASGIFVLFTILASKKKSKRKIK